MSTVVQIFIMKNGGLEGTEMVSGERFVIGSDASSAVVLDDPSIGARHLGVFVHEGKLAVQDLGAPGGTKVNGEVISGPRYIGPREDVALGVFVIKLKLMGVAPRPSAPPSPAATSPPGLPRPPLPLLAKPPPPPVPAPPPLPAPPLLPAEPLLPTSGEATWPPDQQAAGSRDTLSGPSELVTDPVGRRARADDARKTSDDDKTVVDQAPKPSAPSAAVRADPGAAGPALAFALASDDRDDEGFDDDDGDVSWSLVRRLVQPAEGSAGQSSVIEIVHHRGEHVVDHQVIRDGGTFVLGAGWSASERQERGLVQPLPLVRLRKDGVAEVLLSKSVEGQVQRHGGLQAELPSAGATTPLVAGEFCNLRVGAERVFVRFAGVPALLWSKEDLAQVNAQRRLTTVSLASSVAFFGFFIFLSWMYGYRSKGEDIIDLEDDGFAEIVEKDLSFVEPPEKSTPEPVKVAQPVPAKQPDPKTTPTAKTDPVPEAPPVEAPKPGLASMLANIPKVNDTASNQNLKAALSNIKGVRVPGDASGFKTSALTGKGPSAGVQIGGAAGGVATSGINSLIRNDGAAGALGGKGSREVAGKVTTQPRLSQIKGSGELSKDEIQRVINSHVGEIQYCYEKQLRTNAGLAGRVVLEWTVTASGGVSVVKVATSSLSSTDATKCMMDRVKKWSFPKPRGKGAVTIVYPFVFNTI